LERRRGDCQPEFRNLSGLTLPAEADILYQRDLSAGWLGIQQILLFAPERRFTLDSSAEARAAGSSPMISGLSQRCVARFARIGSRAQKATITKCKRRFGRRDRRQATLDELFELGIERDNDLWLRGHAGTIDGRKGRSARTTIFSRKWEIDKNLFQNGFFTVKLGPFLDSGAVRILRPFRLTTLALGRGRAVQGPSPEKPDCGTSYGRDLRMEEMYSTGRFYAEF